MKPTMIWDVIPGVAHIVVHSDEPPSDEDWSQYLRSLVPHARTIRGMLVFSNVVGPTPHQRRAAAEQWQRLGGSPKIAVMTGARFNRGIVTALRWIIGNKIQAFPTNAFDEAASSLGLTDAEREEAFKLLSELCQRAEIPAPPRSARHS